MLDTIVGPTSRHDNILPQIAAMGLHGWTADELHMFALTTHRINERHALNPTALSAKQRAFECHRSQYTNATALREYVVWVGGAVASAGERAAASRQVHTVAEGFLSYF